MNWMVRQEAEFDQYRFAYMCVMIMVISCLGGVAAYISIENLNWFFVAITTFATMGSLSMFIGQASAKVCVRGFYLSMGVSTLVLLACLVLYYL